MKRDDENYDRNSSATERLIESLRGVLLPFPTPFDADARLDSQALSANMRRWSETGIKGYVALGSTGERAHLSEHEFLEAVETARAAAGDLAFIVGAGQQSTRASVEEVRQVAASGADAVLVITPHFYKAEMTQDALAAHYRAVADAAPVPVLLYSVPQFTGVTLRPETIARLSEHENIIGVKDSSGDVLALAETVSLVGEDFAVLTGNGSALYPALCAGARGGILAVACIAPRLAVEIREAFEAGEHEQARRGQQKLSGLTRGVLGRYGIGGLKAALDLLGYAGGHARAPLKDASAGARSEISSVLKEVGLLSTD